MTDELRKPGVAWDLAVTALAKGDLEAAEKLCEWMAPTDAMLMFRKIKAKRDSANLR